MKNKKTLGFIILGISTVLSAITLLFIPVSAYGLYLLLTAYKPAMSQIARIIIAILGAFGVVMAIAFVTSLILH